MFGFNVLGWKPFGFRSTEPTATVGNPFADLQQDTESELVFLFYSRPYDTILKRRVNVCLGNGFASDSDDTLPDGTPFANVLFTAGVISCYSCQNDVMSDGKLADTAIAARNDTLIENKTGRFNYLLALDWEASPTLILAGRPHNKLKDFSVVFSGVTSSVVSVDDENIHIPVVDYSYILQKDIVTTTYRGMNAAIAGDISNSAYGSGTVTAVDKKFTLEFYLTAKTIELSSQKDIIGWKSGTSAGLRLFSLLANNTPSFALRCDDATLYTLTATVVHFQKYFAQHIAITLDINDDTGTATLSLIVNAGASDGSEFVATTTITGKTFDTVLSTLVLFKSPDSSANYSSDTLDEIRIWNYARSKSELAQARNSEIPFDTPGLVYYWNCNEGVDTTLSDSVSEGESNAITLHSCRWVGSLEGATELAGSFTPLWEGIKRFVEPVSVDNQNNVFEISRGSFIALTEVRDKGSLDFVLDDLIEDVYDWTPVSGHCVGSYQGGRNLIRLADPPQGKLTCTINGDTQDTANLILKFMTLYGGLSLTKVNTSTFTRVSLNNNFPIGIGLRLENRTVWDICTELATKNNCVIGSNRRGEIVIYELELPSTPKFTLTTTDVSSARKVNQTLAVYSVALGYLPYASVLTSGEVATSLPEYVKLDYSRSIRYVDPITVELVNSDRRKIHLVQDTLYDNKTDTIVSQKKRLAIAQNDLATYELFLTKGTFQFDIWDDVELTLLMEDGQYFLSMRQWIGKVVGFSEEESNTAQIRLWGVLPIIVPVLEGTIVGGSYLTDEEGRVILAT